jgi:hypothetical protein
MIFKIKDFQKPAIFLIVMTVLVSCEKFNLVRSNTHDPESKYFEPSLPLLTIKDATEVTATSITIAAEITEDGGASVTERGICLSIAKNPTTADFKKAEGAGKGTFLCSFTGLNLGTNYYMRAYSINSVGTSYSEEKIITTLNVPKVYTMAMTGTKATGSYGGGNVTSDGGAEVTTKGLCWNTSGSPTIDNFKLNEGHGTGKFTCLLLDLTAGQKYFLRAFAINKVGISYGDEISFIALGIGDSYKGGIVAYLFKAGNPGYVEGEPHGFIIASSNQSSGIKWASNAVAGTSIELGTGNSNTNFIVANQGLGAYAAKICYDLELNGFTDWYLPSHGDLSAIYPNKSIIGGFTNTFYWSSHFNTANEAWSINFETGEAVPLPVTGMAYVRAIRSF